MKDLKEVLLTHPFFKGMEETYVEFIAGCGKNEHHKKDLICLKKAILRTIFTLSARVNSRLNLFAPGKDRLFLRL